MTGSSTSGRYQIGLTEKQRQRFEAIRAECKEAEPDLPAPSDEQLFSSLLDTWDAVGDGHYSNPMVDIYLCKIGKGAFEPGDEVVCVSDGYVDTDGSYQVDNRRFLHSDCAKDTLYLHTGSEQSGGGA